MEWGFLQDELNKILESKTFGTLVAGAFGAFFGALGAQFVIRRGQNRQELVAELNGTNAALSLCFFTTNVFLSLKKHQVRPMCDAYEDMQKKHAQFLAALKSYTGPRPPSFTIQADWETLSPPRIPSEMLERSVLEKISIRGRGFAAAAQLVNSVDLLEKAVLYRNDLIEEFRKQAPLPPKRLAEVYLGTKDQNGFEDARYSSVISAIKAYTDDCIFYSKVLGDDLEKYGGSLRKKGKWKFQFFLPKVTEIDWSSATQNALMPDSNEYKRWLKGFRKRETTIDWLKGVLGCAKGKK